MPAFLLGVVALLLLLFAGSAFVKADPKQTPRVLRWIGGGAALLLADFCCFGAQLRLPSRSVLSGWVCSAGCHFGRPLLDRGHKEARDKRRVSERPSLKWNSIMTPAG